MILHFSVCELCQRSPRSATLWVVLYLLLTKLQGSNSPPNLSAFFMIQYCWTTFEPIESLHTINAWIIAQLQISAPLRISTPPKEFVISAPLPREKISFGTQYDIYETQRRLDIARNASWVNNPKRFSLPELSWHEDLSRGDRRYA